MAYAQKKNSEKNNNFLVRQSFESLDKKSEPATLFLTFPNNKAFSYTIDGGIAFERESLKSSKKIIIEYHRNTLIDKEQNNAQIGFSGDFYLGNLATNKTNYALTSTAKYVRDIVASKGSLLHTLELGILSPVLNTPIRTNKVKENYFIISPSIGYEFQNIFDSKPDTRDSLIGNIFRGVGKIKITHTFNSLIKSPEPKLTPKPTCQDSLGRFVPSKSPLFEIDSFALQKIPFLQIYFNGTLRYDIINSTETPNGWHPYLDFGINYILSTNKSLEPRLLLGASFIYGENPAQGLLHQRYLLIALKFIL